MRSRRSTAPNPLRDLPFLQPPLSREQTELQAAEWLGEHADDVEAVDDVIAVLPIARPESFDDGDPGTYRKIQRCRQLVTGAGARNGCRRPERLTDGSEQVPLQPEIIN